MFIANNLYLLKLDVSAVILYVDDMLIYVFSYFRSTDWMNKYNALVKQAAQKYNFHLVN